jgi:Tfp pilus assembly protein PilE
MKSRQHFKPKSKILRFKWRLKRDKSTHSSSQGFTLIEFLVAGIVSTVVILVAWSGLVSAMNVSQEGQARAARQSELNKALDFMTNEIRMASFINKSSATANTTAPPSSSGKNSSTSNNATATATTTTLTDVVTSAGVNLSDLGSYGTLALYLERPTSSNPPAICPLGGPNAGFPPPTPTRFDRIVYDIRPSSSGWLKPQMLARYGRLPAADGTINSCSSPVSSDPIVDALSTTRSSKPTCSGVLSGAGGFYSCVNGREVDLLFQSDISHVESRQANSSTTSRLKTINSTPDN